MGGAFATSALNAGAFFGPVLAGWSLGAVGVPGPAWCAAAAVVLASVVAKRTPAIIGRR